MDFDDTPEEAAFRAEARTWLEENFPASLAGKAGVSVSLATGSLIIGVIAMVYVTAGGLKAAVWADLIQGSALVRR